MSDATSTISIGAPAPDFVLPNENGERWSLSEQKGSVAVLLFYPRDETLVCTRQMCSLRDNWTTYLDTKAVIVGISPGLPEEHKKFSENHHLPLPLLADDNFAITRLYAKHWLYPVNFTRAVVVVDSSGVVRSREIMLRAFRPKDSHVISSIYAARSEALDQRYEALKTRIKNATDT